MLLSIYQNKSLLAFLSAFFFSFLILSCKDEGTPPIELPEGYQEDITWPSLADSPWPMNHHDPQSTGRSKYSGPKFGIIEWEKDSIYMEGGISIGPDSTIYFVSVTPNNKGLYAVKPDGKVRWILKDIIKSMEVFSAPLIASDGTIYVGGGLEGKLYAVNPDGTLKWELQTLEFNYQVGLNIGKDGTLYLLNGGPRTISKLVAINPTGKIDWYYENEMIDYSGGSGTSISPDGRTIYVPGKNPTIFAIDLETHQLKWTFGNSRYQATPSVDNIGNIYFIAKSDTVNSGYTSIYCLKSNGKIKWSYNFGWSAEVFHFVSEGAIDREGNYYFSLDTLYSFDYNGNRRWKMDITGSDEGSIVCDNVGNIYMTVDMVYPLKCYSIDKNGNVLWIVDLGNNFGGFSPALGANSRIYIPTFKSTNVFAIK